jgi:hypothetical protein
MYRNSGRKRVDRTSPVPRSPGASARSTRAPATSVGPGLVPLPWVGAWGALAALTATLVTLRWTAWSWVGLLTAAAFGLLPWAIGLTRLPTTEPRARGSPRVAPARPAPVRPAEVSPLAGALPPPRPPPNPGRANRPAAVVATNPQGPVSLVAPPRVSSASRSAGRPTDRPVAAAPQFQLLVRMLDDIDQLEAAVSRAHGANETPAARVEPSPRALGSCADCELPYEGPEEVGATCRDCGGSLCVECAADAAADGHRDSCDLCWTLETGLRARSGTPRPQAVAAEGNAAAPAPALRRLPSVVGSAYGSTRP